LIYNKWENLIVQNVFWLVQKAWKKEKNDLETLKEN
jgi:hypothetical protein